MFRLIQSRPPHPLLKPFIQYFYAAERTGTPDPCRQLKIPSSQGFIVFCVRQWASARGDKGPAASARLLVAGPNPFLMPIPLSDRQFIGAKVQPGTYKAFLGEAAKTIRGLALPLSYFWGRDAEILKERMALAHSLEERWDLMEQVFLERFQRQGEGDPYARQAAQFMEKEGWKLPMKRLASYLGYTDRQIRRQFDDWVGLGPKEFQRVSRCRSLVLELLRTPSGDWAQKVEQYGYFDQAHMIHEFKGFMGQTPERFLESLRSGIRPETLHFSNGTQDPLLLSYPFEKLDPIPTR